jgi:hypothetical protein
MVKMIMKYIGYAFIAIGLVASILSLVSKRPKGQVIGALVVSLVGARLLVWDIRVVFWLQFATKCGWSSKVIFPEMDRSHPHINSVPKPTKSAAFLTRGEVAGHDTLLFLLNIKTLSGREESNSTSPHFEEKCTLIFRKRVFSLAGF